MTWKILGDYYPEFEMEKMKESSQKCNKIYLITYQKGENREYMREIIFEKILAENLRSI